MKLSLIIFGLLLSCLCKAQDTKRVIFKNESIEITAGPTQVIIPKHYTKSPSTHLFKLRNGDLIVNTNWAEVTGGMRSVDSGKTWQKAYSAIDNVYEDELGISYTRLTDQSYQMKNGDIIMFYNWYGKKAKGKGVYKFPFYTWNSDGSRESQGETTVRLPSFMPRGPWPNHSIIELRDGSLMATVQGKFPNDKRERVFTIRSVDHGKIWNFYSNVAIDREAKYLDGFCEPDLLVLPNGRILCFMRTSGYKEVSPIHLSESKDDGKTWTNAKPITKFGVYPSSCQLKDGTILLFFGRPGDWLTVSEDNGYTWSAEFELIHEKPINTVIDEETVAPDSGHYNCIEEIAPGKLLVVYARTDAKEPLQSEIVGTILDVRQLK